MSDFADLVEDNLVPDLFEVFGDKFDFVQGSDTVSDVVMIREDVSTEYSDLSDVRTVEADFLFKIQIDANFVIGETAVTPAKGDTITDGTDTYDIILPYKDNFGQVWICECVKVDA